MHTVHQQPTSDTHQGTVVFEVSFESHDSLGMTNRSYDRTAGHNMVLLRRRRANRLENLIKVPTTTSSDASDRCGDPSRLLETCPIEADSVMLRPNGRTNTSTDELELVHER